MPGRTNLPILNDPDCTRCQLHELTNRVCVLGAGPTDAKVMVIGEAPGRREEETGVPFMGRAGKVLREALIRSGLDPQTTYITNAVNCRPPENRTPKKGEIKACRHWVKQRIEAIKPKAVLLLGNVPLISITGEGGIKSKRGRPFDKDGIIYLPTYHPAYILRDDRAMPAFEADIRLFVDIIRRGKIPREEGLDWTIVDTIEKFEEMLDDLYGTVSFDIETTSLYPWSREPLKDNPLYKKRRRHGINTIGLGTKRKQWCWPIHHPGSDWDWDSDNLPAMLRRVRRKLEQCILVGHNGKFDSLWMRVHHGEDWRVDFDTMLAHYCVDENAHHSLKLLSAVYYGAPDYDEDVKLKTGERGTIEEHCKYLAHDLYYTRKLRFTLGKELAKDPSVQRVFEQLLMPCASLYVDIEYNGVPIDTKRMDEVGEYLLGKIDEAEKELKKYGDINWGSPKQVAELLFVKLKLHCPEKTKNGAPSTSESALNQIRHPCIESLLKLRGAKQQHSFFIKGWRPFLVRGRLHPSFKLHGTVTGRPSCEHPNLQQTSRDALIRSLIASIVSGWEIVEFDLSQIEMRLAAELSGDRTLLGVFDRDEDVHWMTAIREIGRTGAYPTEVIETANQYLKSLSRTKKVSYGEAIDILYKIGPEVAEKINKAWKEARKKAKAVNFGYLYGMWWKKFIIYARDNYGVKVTAKQAQASREAFFALYKSLSDWHNRQRRFAQRNGYVRSLAGRKRRLPVAMSQDDTPARAEAQRQAINSPVQSFASDINLMVLLQLTEEFPQVQAIGTIHDAILVFCPIHLVETVALRGLEIMKRPKLFDTFGINLRVPIKGDCKVGAWGKGIPLEQWLASTPVSQRSIRGDVVGKNTTSSSLKPSNRKPRSVRLPSAS